MNERFELHIEADSALGLRRALAAAAAAQGANEAAAMGDDDLLQYLRERMMRHGALVRLVPFSTVKDDPDYDAYCVWCLAHGMTPPEPGSDDKEAA
jgi:hypothetical protein